jgi:hypothetical protein
MLKPFLTLALLSWFLTLFMPWWTIAISGVLVGAWMITSWKKALVVGFLASALAWGMQAALVSWQNGGILAGRLSVTFFGFEAGWLMLLSTGVVAGVLGSVATLAGQQFKRAVR